jgi:hypothetical protein
MRTENSLHFDGHIFESHWGQPVSARYMGLDRWKTPGVDFVDFGRMRTTSQVQFHGRDHTAVPSFALNLPEMKLLVARYFELRAGMRYPKVGTPEWRLKMALRKIQKDIPKDREVMARLNREYVELKRQGADPERLRERENAIRSLDSEIRMALRGEAPVVALIYFHFRLGYNSCQTASELGIFPQTIRQIAYKLAKLWNLMQSGQDRQPTEREIANAKVREYRRNFTPEQKAAFAKYQADYRKANKKVILANGQRWRDANRELVRKQSREANERWLKKKKAERGSGRAVRVLMAKPAHIHYHSCYAAFVR